MSVCAHHSVHPSYTPYPIMLFHYVRFFFIYSCLDKEAMTVFLPRQAVSSLLSFYFVNESEAGEKKRI